jgi:dephospho-CoA kinase
MLLKVGLTGGIGTGRSTLSSSFRARDGWLVLDADKVAHELMAPGGEATSPIRDAFGKESVGAGGEVNRAVLGRKVFKDPVARRKLEKILHPMILARMEERAEAFAEAHMHPIAVFDAALMVETGSYKRYHRIVVAHCSRETQIERVILRDGAGREQVEARLQAQLPIEDKMAVADYLIDTTGTVDETLHRATRIAIQLESDARMLPNLPERNKT